jgi:uncharacterized protein YjiS (DUF1127 family)
MLNPQSAIVAIRRHNSPGQASRDAPRDRGDIPSKKVTPTTESSKAEVVSLPAKRPATAQADATWPPAFWFFLEGFALYGASFHGFATTAVTATTGEVGVRQHQKPARSERQKSITLVSSAAPAEITVLRREDVVDRTAFGTRMPSAKDGFAFPAREIEQYRFVRPGWLTVIRRAIAGRWAKLRHDREVKKAVAALAEYDDRTLRDMGIPDRGHIEQSVREGRDT